MIAQRSSQKLTRVLVTGGSGFLGAHVVDQLLADPAMSVAIVSRKPKASQATKDDLLSTHAADIVSEAQIKAIFDKVKPQAVIHTASAHHTDKAAALMRTNVEGTKLLLKCAQASSETCAFVYTSSDSAIVPTQELLTEDRAKRYEERSNTGISPYALSKALAEAAVQTVNCEDLRTALVSRVRKKEHKLQVGQNKKVFEFVYVDKAAEAHIPAAHALVDVQTATSSGVAGEAFFVADGRSEPFFDFARRCYAAIGSPVAPNEITVIPMPVMQAMVSVVEWAYWISTLGTKRPELRRDSIDHLDRGCC